MWATILLLLGWRSRETSGEAPKRRRQDPGAALRCRLDRIRRKVGRKGPDYFVRGSRRNDSAVRSTRALSSMLKIALLDDYARVALKSADWSVLKGKANITIFERHLSEDEAAVLLRPFDVLCTIRERMSLPRSLFQRLPDLKLVTIIGMSIPNPDLAAATEQASILAH